MKNPMYKLLVLVLLVSFGFTAEAQRTKIAKNQIPDQINTYLKKHFPNNPVTKAAFDNHMVYKKYEITLKDKTSLEFSPAFEVTEIKSKSKLPDSVVPKDILKYVNANYPNNVVTDWELDDGIQKIELNNGLDIDFTKEGQFIGIDD